MLKHCLYCGTRVLEFEPPGRWRVNGRLAFDPERGRIWTVCHRCHGWSLWWRDDRRDALDHLERLAFHARLLYQTDNISLLERDGQELIRIGKAQRREKAWWRYGRALRRRRTRYHSALSKIGAVTYGAVSYLGAKLGLSGITGEIDWEAEPLADILRWRQFGLTAWSGRAACPFCHSVLLKLRYYATPSLYLLQGGDGRLAIGLPCARCDIWTIDRVHRLEGDTAQLVIRRVLAHKNISGAAEGELQAAVGVIEEAGSPGMVLDALVAREKSLADLKPMEALALEICVNESAERRQLAAEVAAIESHWREANELATIIDRELTPDPPS